MLRARGRGVIALSLLHFADGLLIEVYDTDSNPPVLCDADAENGRGLMLIDALAKEWSYFFLRTAAKSFTPYWACRIWACLTEAFDKSAEIVARDPASTPARFRA